MTYAVFLHVPKTAGMSLHDTLRRQVGDEAVSPSVNASVMTQSEADALAHYDVVVGHISVTDARRFFPGAALLTVLRDPIERSLSWYYYARNFPWAPHEDVAAAQAHPVEEFFDLPTDVVFENIHNRQVRQLGDHVYNYTVDLDQALENAKATLDACAWVGRQETLDADLARLADVLPAVKGASLDQLNVTTTRPSDRAISPSLRESIMRHNAFDQRLYDYAASIAP